MERSVRRNSLKGFRSGLRSLRPVMILILISIKLKIKTLNAVNVVICNAFSPLGDLGLLHQDKPTSCTSSAAFSNASIVKQQSKSSAAGGNRSSCFLSVAPAASEQRRCIRFHSGLHVGDSGCFSRRVTQAINWRLARAAGLPSPSPAGMWPPAKTQSAGEAKWKWMDGFCSLEKTRLIPSAAMYEGSVPSFGRGKASPRG